MKKRFLFLSALLSLASCSAGGTSSDKPQESGPSAFDSALSSESAEESLKEETSSLSEKEQFLSYLTSLNETHRYTARLSYSVLSEDG
ncbi:MAG: hypothetical protein SPI58_01370, partial [Candidatus Enteromonas sp.]|nr:hypothetical protein [Candidatus Enteromonas sp.]